MRTSGPLRGDVVEREVAAGDDVREDQQQRDDDDVVEHGRVRGREELSPAR